MLLGDGKKTADALVTKAGLVVQGFLDSFKVWGAHFKHHPFIVRLSRGDNIHQ